MRAFSLAETATALGGSLHGDDARFQQVSTDSRSLAAGALFVALRGERFDGHDYLDQAIGRQACAAVVSRCLDSPIRQIRVADTEQALGVLGRMNRAEFSGPVIGITGSAGKTGTKEMIAAVLGDAATVHATRGNLNNEIGVPLTLLALQRQHRFAVIEMGAGRPGDIAYLAGLAQPEVAVVTNALPAHIEGFGTVAAIAQTKGALFEALPPGGTAVLNLDDPQAPAWQEQIGARRVVSWSLTDTAASVTAADIVVERDATVGFLLCLPGERLRLRLRLLGTHQVANALAAAAVGHALNIAPAQIAAGLESVRPMPGRLCPRRLRHGGRLIDDTYNANPGSMRAAVQVLASCSGRRVMLIGDMAEMGKDAERHHRELGQYARQHGVDLLLATGVLSQQSVQAFADGASHHASRESLSAAARPLLGPDTVILVKGSRSAAMEGVVEALVAAGGGEDG